MASLEEIRSGRIQKLEILKSRGVNPYPAKVPRDFPIDFFVSRTGFNLSTEEIISILERLGFSCKNEKETIQITIPSWRYDVSIKEDIVEEVQAFEELWGCSPSMIVLDNLMDVATDGGEEFASMRAIMK